MLDTTFRNAYFIKLGRGGKWEADCLKHHRARIGWTKIARDDLNAERWEDIERTLRTDATNMGTATNELNRLRDFADSSPEDIWITFSGNTLWWGRLGGPIQEDSESKYRCLVGRWSDKSATGRLLVASELPGKLAQMQGFRSTICRVNEAALLRRVLSGQRSSLADELSRNRETLVGSVSRAIEQLHWKDFESLVDMVFRHAGWKRIGILGQQVKSYDLALHEPVTGERFLVQVKSRASLADLYTSIKDIASDDYRRIFYAVHSPEKDLAQAEDLPEHVDLVAPRRLAELSIDAGLLGWLEEKVA